MSIENSEAIHEIENKEENSGKEGSILGLVQQMFSGFTKISSELSENVRILTEQNNVLLKGRDKHISRREEFESNKNHILIPQSVQQVLFLMISKGINVTRTNHHANKKKLSAARMWIFLKQF